MGNKEIFGKIKSGVKRFKITFVNIPVADNRNAEIKAQIRKCKKLNQKVCNYLATPPGRHRTDLTNGPSRIKKYAIALQNKTKMFFNCI